MVLTPSCASKVGAAQQRRALSSFAPVSRGIPRRASPSAFDASVSAGSVVVGPCARCAAGAARAEARQSASRGRGAPPLAGGVLDSSRRQTAGAVGSIGRSSGRTLGESGGRQRSQAPPRELIRRGTKSPPCPSMEPKRISQPAEFSPWPPSRPRGQRSRAAAAASASVEGTKVTKDHGRGAAAQPFRLKRATTALCCGRRARARQKRARTCAGPRLKRARAHRARIAPTGADGATSGMFWEAPAWGREALA